MYMKRVTFDFLSGNWQNLLMMPTINARDVHLLEEINEQTVTCVVVNSS